MATWEGWLYGPGYRPNGLRYYQTPLRGAPGGGWGEGSCWAVRDVCADDYVLDAPQDNLHIWTGTMEEALDKARQLNRDQGGCDCPGGHHEPDPLPRQATGANRAAMERTGRNLGTRRDV
jgi:hypothetical protein